MADLMDHPAAVEKRLEHLAIVFNEMRWREPRPTVQELQDFLGDHAASLIGFARQVDEEYVRIVPPVEREFPSLAQGVALARFLQGRLITGAAQVIGGSLALPTYHLAVICADGHEGGIAPDGTVSVR